MLIATVVLMAAVLGGAVATYLFDDRSRLAYRLAAGACLGVTVLGLVGYVAAAWIGMNAASLLIATGITLAVPLRLAPRGLSHLRDELRRELRRRWTRRRIAALVCAVEVLLALALCFERAMDVRGDGIYTSYVDNYADLTLHIGIITGFVYGENYPPEHPEYAGTRLAYPFVADFVAAMLVAAGASLAGAMFLQNMVLTAALLVLLYVWGRRLTGDRIVGALTVAFVMMSGGLGFLMLFDELRGVNGQVWHYLTHLPHDYTAHEQRFRWANSLVYWFVPMRSMLLGVPLFLVVTGLWWRALGYEPPEPIPQDDAAPGPASKPGKKSKKAKGESNGPVASAVALERPAASALPAPPAVSSPSSFSPERMMAAAGAITGLLVLAHAHTAVTLGLMGLLLMFITRQWRMWIVFGAILFVIGFPQGLWAISGSSVKGDTFFGVHPGWSGHDEAQVLAGSWGTPEERLKYWTGFSLGVARYWLMNTGLVIPLLAIAVLWRGRRPVVPTRLLLFYAPFVLCFVVPNIWKFAPWEWDNIKVLIYWFIPSVPLIALLLARLWRGSYSEKVAAALCAVGLCLSGGLDIWRVMTGALQWRVFGNDEIAMGELIREMTPPRAVMLNAALHNHAFMLSGRRSFFGYPGTLWTHGISGDIYTERETAMKRIYAGEPDARELIERYKIDYAVVGPMERDTVKPLNEEFFRQFQESGRAGGGVLYKLR